MLRPEYTPAGIGAAGERVEHSGILVGIQAGHLIVSEWRSNLFAHADLHTDATPVGAGAAREIPAA